jgi:hypothetical protein
MNVPDPSDRRKYPRIDVDFPVSYTRTVPLPEVKGVGSTHNLSEEGACLELAQRLGPPSILQVELQTDQGVLALSAAVTWAAIIKEKGEGIIHGVVFARLGAEQREMIRRVLHAHGVAGDEGPTEGQG